MSKPPVIFLAFSNDKETASGYLRNLTKERNLIKDALEKAQLEQICELVVEPDASLDKIFDVFQNPKYRNRIAVFHYGGHADDYGLLLEDSEGKKSFANAEGLSGMLAAQNGLQLVFLNGCSTQLQAEELKDAGIPAVIGTTQKVPDEIACALAERFYKGLGAGLSFQVAWQEADHLLKSKKNSFGAVRNSAVVRLSQLNSRAWNIYYQTNSKKIREWNLPEAAGNLLFGLPVLDKKYYLSLPPAPYIGLKRFEQKDAAIFFGRNNDIRKLCDQLSSDYPVILYHGRSGVGKSSLLEAGFTPRTELTNVVRVVRRNQNLGLSNTLTHFLYTVKQKIEGGPEGAEVGSEAAHKIWSDIEKITGKPLIIVLDQVEESFTKSILWGYESEWKEFIEQVGILSKYLIKNSSGKLILSFRTEYFTEIRKLLDDASIPWIDAYLRRLDRVGIVEAICGVTIEERLKRKYKLSIEGRGKAGGVTDEIASDLLKDQESPLGSILQLLLEKLWEQASVSEDRSRFINNELYSTVRNAGITLFDFMHKEFEIIRQLNSDITSSFFEQEIEQSGLLLDILLNLTTPKGTADAVQVDQLIALYPHHNESINPLLIYLDSRRIVHLFTSNKAQMAGLSHDTLAPIVREFFERSERPGSQAKRILINRLYDKNKDSKDAFLHESDLSIVEKGLTGMRSLNQEEAALISRSRKRKKFIDLSFKALEVFKFDHTLALNLAIEACKGIETRQTKFSLGTIFRNSKGLYRKSFNGHESLVTSVAFSPDGTCVLTGSMDGTAKLWSLNGLEIQSYVGHESSVSSVAFSPDGRFVLTGSMDRTAILWNLNGMKIQSFVGHADEILTVTFSPNGKLVLTGSQDKTAKLWDLNGIEVQSFVGHADEISSIAFSPDGKYVLTGGYGDIAKLWDMNGLEVQSFIGHKSIVPSVAFSPDGKYVLTGSHDETAKLWNLDGIEVQSFIGLEGIVSSISFSPDGKYVAAGSGDRPIKLWNLDGIEVQSFIGQEGVVTSIAFSPDGKLLLTGSWDQTAKLWNLDGIEVQSFVGYEDVISSIAISSDGKFVLGGGLDKTAKLWSLDGTVVQSFVGHQDIISSVAFSPDREFVLTGSEDKTAKLWNLDGIEIQSFIGHEDAILSIAFSPDGKNVLAGGYDRTAKLWDLNGKIIQSFVGHESVVTAVAFSPEGKYVLTGSEGKTAKLWGLDGIEIQSFAGHEYYILAVAFSPDGKYVLTGSMDKTAKLWDLNGTEVQSFVGHASVVISVAFSPDGKYILTGSPDKTAKLWDLDGIEVQSFIGNKEGISTVAFSPDGKFIFTAGDKRYIKRWPRWDVIQELGIITPLTKAQKEEYGIQ